MLRVSEVVEKELSKGNIPKDIYLMIYNALIEIDKNKDITLYDVRDIKDQHHKLKYHYYRLRKGKFRAIFYFSDDDTYLYAAGKREDIYNNKKIKLI